MGILHWITKARHGEDYANIQEMAIEARSWERTYGRWANEKQALADKLGRVGLGGYEQRRAESDRADAEYCGRAAKALEAALLALKERAK